MGYTAEMEQDSKVFLSAVIPVYNEQGKIESTYRTIKRYLDNQRYNYEIIIVDDGSKDETSHIIERLIKADINIKIYLNPNNLGKGAAVKRGILKSNGKYILFLDADLSTPIEELEKFLPWFNEGFDIVIGSRRTAGANIQKHQLLHREFMGIVYTWLANKLLLLEVSDITCGFKCFKKEVALDIFQKQRSADWSFDAEILSIARRRHYKIKEVPVNWWNYPRSHVVLFRDSIKSFFGLIKIRINKYR